MKTNEFFSKIKVMGLTAIVSSGGHIGIRGLDSEHLIAGVHRDNYLDFGITHYLSDEREEVRCKVPKLVIAYAKTPIADREEHRWNVIVGRSLGFKAVMTAYCKDDFSDLSIAANVWPFMLKSEAFQFSDDEFAELIEALKAEQNGEMLAKIAEMGKVPAPEADE